VAQEREMEMNKDDELLERLEGYNPPDRTIPSWRPIAVDITEAAARIRELKAENARLIQDANESNRILGDMCEQQSKRAECAEADLAAAVTATMGYKTPWHVRLAELQSEALMSLNAAVTATERVEKAKADCRRWSALCVEREADLAAAVAALVGVVRVADRATDEFDAARAVVAAHMKEKP